MPDSVTPKLIYVASPYGAEKPESIRRERVTLARRFTQHFVLAVKPWHAIPYCPVAFWAGWGEPQAMEESVYQVLEECYLSQCDELWVLQLDGWRQSKGVAREMALAERLGLPVRFATMLDNASTLRQKAGEVSA